MNGPTLQVQMLGQFTLRYGDRTISDSDDRSRRVWSLLAYMLYNHGRSFAQEELIHLYWSNNEKSADPGNALKSIFHRIRTALDKLQPGLGRLLIRRKAGRYFWNNVMPLCRFPSILRILRRIFMPPKPPEMTMSVWRNISLHWHCMPAIRCRA